MPTQLSPPSSVRSTDPHGAVRHGAVPSTHPSEALTNVTEYGLKPAGTGPPDGPGAAARVAAGLDADARGTLATVLAAVLVAREAAVDPAGGGDAVARVLDVAVSDEPGDEVFEVPDEHPVAARPSAVSTQATVKMGRDTWVIPSQDLMGGS